MLQKTKSLLLKLLMLLCVACCAVALAFSLAGCSGVTVDHMEIDKTTGHLIVYYTDGSKADLGLVVGADGETPSTGSTVTDVVIDEKAGTITIYYSDKEPETYTLGGGQDESCEHTHVQYVLLDRGTAPESVKWTCDFGGSMLEVCDDCGYTAIVPVTGHHYVETTVAPTCINEGYTAMICEYCGAEDTSVERTDVLPATGEHVYATEGFQVAYPGKTLCDGGWTIYPCTLDNCGHVKYEDLEATGHNVESFSVTKTPTAADKGEAIGYCTTCGEEVPVELPALSNLSGYEYKFTSEEINCSENMTAEFTYTPKDYDVEIKFTATIEAHKHTFDGKLFDDEVVHYYASVSEIPEGMLLPDNEKLTCEAEKYSMAYFFCEVCNRPVAAKIRISHTMPANASTTTLDDEAIATAASQVGVTGDTDVEKAASWYQKQITAPAEGAEAPRTVYYYAASCGGHDGFRVYYCSVCKTVVIDTIDAPAHEYVYTATTNTDGTVTITATCANCDTVNAYLVLEDYEADVRTVADCETEGLVIYTGTLADVDTNDSFKADPAFSKFVNGENVRITAVTPKTLHVDPYYGAKFVTDRTQIADENIVYYIEDYPLIAPHVADNSSEDCGDGDNQVFYYFKCEDCSQTFSVIFKHKHSMPTSAVTDITDSKNSAYAGYDTEDEAKGYLATLDSEDKDYNIVLYKPATCTANGFYAYICADCGSPETETIVATGHKYEYSITGSGSNLTMNVKCLNEGCTLDSSKTPVEVNSVNFPLTLTSVNPETTPKSGNYVVTSQTPATCTTPSTVTYTVYIWNAEANDGAGAYNTPIVIRQTGSTISHLLNGTRVDISQPLDPADYPEGLITIAVNYPSTCNSTDVGYGYFYCEDCGEMISVQLRGGHTQPTAPGTLPEGVTTAAGIPESGSDNTTGFEKGYLYTVKATCTEAGAYGYFCTVCEQWVKETIPATEHNLVRTSIEYLGFEEGFKVTYECTNTDCELDPVKVTLQPFAFGKESTSVVTLNDGYTYGFFNEPTHNTYGNFSMSYTVDYKKLVEEKPTLANYVSKNFSDAVTLSGIIDREVASDNLHYHFSYNPGQGNEGTTNYYWFEDVTNKDGEVVRTYYVGYLCNDCGEIWSKVQKYENAEGKVVDAVFTGEDNIPDNDEIVAQNAFDEAQKAEDAADAA